MPPNALINRGDTTMLVADDSETRVGAQIASRRSALGMSIKALAELVSGEWERALNDRGSMAPQPFSVSAEGPVPSSASWSRSSADAVRSRRDCERSSQAN